ncbi:MAG: autotransporter domain-containing protein [bacterium]|nr:autotransporter domain-containing protein [bacterium]
MKRIFIPLFLVFLVSFSVRADEDRTGLYTAIGPSVGSEMGYKTSLGGGLGVRIGGGFNDRVLLFYNSWSHFGSKNGHPFFLGMGEMKFQFFLLDDFYLNAGAGAAFTNFNPRTGNNELIGAGFGGSGGMGYEFYLTDQVVLAPEVSFTYCRAKASNFYLPQAFLLMGWHF